MNIFKNLFTLFTPKEYKRFFLLLGLIFTLGLLDILGIASIMPFIAVLTNPNLIETNFILNRIFEFSKVFGIKNNYDFSFLLGFVVFFLLVFSLLIKGITLFYQYKFIYQLEKTLGARLLRNYLKKNYSWFLDRHSANLAKNILSEIQLIIENAIRPMIDLISRSILVIFILALLFIVDIKLTTIIFLILSFFYIVFFLIFRKYLNRIGDKRLQSNESRFTLINEAFGAIKELKLAGLEKIFENLFLHSAQQYAKSQTSFQVISKVPRFFIEGILFGGIILIILTTMYRGTNFVDTLPVFSLFLYSGYRLMPAVQQIYTSVSQIRFAESTIKKVFFEEIQFENSKQNKDKHQQQLFLNKSIYLKNVSYKYPNSSILSLKNINLSIAAKSIVGITGATGCGKSTLVDIISGLLQTQSGSLIIDEKELVHKNIRSWQNSIGYVPQNIYLFDDTIAANIIFNQNSDDINEQALIEASKIANLHDFILNELPEQYQTRVGERGVRLSGGQLQRIGIARAIYNKPSLLILDEATSALDVQTEKSVMDSINNISQNTTIIIIAHRLNTLKNCEKIFLLEKGEIKKVGNYDEIISLYN